MDLNLGGLNPILHELLTRDTKKNILNKKTRSRSHLKTFELILEKCVANYYGDNFLTCSD